MLQGNKQQQSQLGLHSLSPQICQPLRSQRDIHKLELSLPVDPRPRTSTEPNAASLAFDARLQNKDKTLFLTSCSFQSIILTVLIHTPTFSPFLITQDVDSQNKDILDYQE